MIRPVAASRLIDAWDAGVGQHMIDRALTIAGCYTDLDRERLAAMSIGERDALLLRIRRMISGNRLAGLCACAACGGPNEFDLDADALPEPSAPPDGVIAVKLGERTLRARLPNSFDLAAVADTPDEEEAIRALVRRCLIDDGEIGDGAIEEAVAAIDGAMEAAEGIAGLKIAFSCAACGAANSTPLDIAGFLWAELSERAQRLIADVELLASCYGWREADILAMSERRRTLYAERLRQ
jgi:hypothetical protein